MKRTHLISLITGLFVLALASLAAAQMMGNGNNQSMMNTNDSTSQHVTMNRQSMTKVDNLMGNMSERFNMMTAEFDSLDYVNQQMMQMNNLDNVKAKLKQQNEMLQRMHQRMAQQQSTLQNMMAMMPNGNMPNSSMMNSTRGSNNMHGMMGSGNTSSSSNDN